jgi:O-antigen ligase
LYLIWIASSIHVFFIILQLILPELVNSINSMILNVDLTALEMIQDVGAIKGINVQSAPAGLIATVFVGFIASDLIVYKENRIKKIILLIIGILSIILTLKRSFFISSIIGIYFLVFLKTWDRRASKLFKIVGISFILVIVLFVSIEAVPHLQVMIERTMRVGRALSGREQMYSHMWMVFKENPIFGIGNGYTEAIYTYGSHNVYLQLLAETGIVGFALFSFIFIRQFLKNIRISEEYIKYNASYHSAKKRIFVSLYMQVVFFMYCLSGNPLYDYTFLMLFMVFFIVPELEMQKNIQSRTILEDKVNEKFE